MLYQWYEWQHAAVAPWRAMADSTLRWIAQAPEAHENPFARAALANLELFERLTRRWGRPEFDLDHTMVNGHRVAVHPEPAWERPFCTLTHFRRQGDHDDPHVLVVAPLSGHFATLLRGTIESLLPEHDVYITEWANARDVPLAEGAFDLDDYVDYVIAMLEELGPETHVLAVCQPVVPVLAAVSLMAAEDHPAQPRSMTLMAGPIDARYSPTSVNDFATSQPMSWFEQFMVTTVPWNHRGAGRKVYPGFTQLGAFVSMNPDRHFESHLGLVRDVMLSDESKADRHRTFYDEYFSVMDLTAEYYLQTVDRVFQRFELARGEFVSRGRTVDPSAIRRTALMTVEGERDDITGLGQTRAAHLLCSSLGPEMRDHHEQADVGHFGVFSGHHWHNETMPRFAEFIRRYERID